MSSMEEQMESLVASVAIDPAKLFWPVAKKLILSQVASSRAHDTRALVNKLIAIAGVDDVCDADQKLILAVLRGNREALLNAIDEGGDLNCKLDNVGILDIAMWWDQKSLISTLLDKGANPNAQRSDGGTILMDAAIEGDLALVKTLVERGANVNLRGNNNRSAYFLSISSENEALMDYLADRGAEINIVLNNNGLGVFANAFCNGDPDHVNKLLSIGADPLAVNDAGQTDLMAHTLEHAPLEIARKLLRPELIGLSPRSETELFDMAVSRDEYEDISSSGFLDLLISLGSSDFVSRAYRGDAAAQFELAKCYEHGNACEQDDDKAFHWYEKSALQGNADAQIRLGSAYMDNSLYCVDEDVDLARKWYLEAANQGVAEAQYRLGKIFDDGEDGGGVEKHYEQAVSWFRRAAEQNHLEAQVRLGLMYQCGTGVEQSESNAASWYRRAADHGNANAQYLLGVISSEGQGVEKSLAEAVRWWSLSADNGNAEAQFKLGVCFLNGEGVEEDKARAFEWFSRAAEANHLNSQFILGLLNYSGDGTPQNYGHAYRWFTIAHFSGHEKAQRMRGIAAAKLEQSEVEEINESLGIGASAQRSLSDFSDFLKSL